MVLVVAVLLVGFLGYRQLERWRGEVVTVWFAASDLEQGARVSAEQMTSVQMRQRAVPQDAVLDHDAIQGADLLRPKPAGAPFLKADLRKPPPARAASLAETIPEGRVMMAYTIPGFPIAQLANMLRLNDRFDIFAVSQTEPLHLAHDAIFMGWIRPPGRNGNGNGNGSQDRTVGTSLVERYADAAAEVGSAAPPSTSPPLLLAVRPEDVRRLVWLRSAGIKITVVLHGRTESDKGELVTFPAQEQPRAAEIEVILGAKRRRIPLRNLK